MAHGKSVLDVISDAVAPVMRTINDVNVSILSGTKVSVLRIEKDRRDIFGEQEENYKDHVIGNCVIDYPFDKVELYGRKNAQEQTTHEVIEVFDLLPIEMEISFEGDQATEPIELARGDLLVDIFFDHLGTKIPVILEVERLSGSFFGKNLVGRRYQLSLFRSPLSNEFQTVIDKYVDEYTNE